MPCVSTFQLRICLTAAQLTTQVIRTHSQLQCNKTPLKQSDFHIEYVYAYRI